MRYEFETVGPIMVTAKLRGSNLTVIVSEDAPVAVVTVEPRRGGDDVAARTRVEMSGNRLQIEVPKVTGSLFRQGGSVAIEAIVPPGSSLEADSGSGELRAQGALLRAEVRNGSGGIDLEDVGEARVTSGSGDVVLGDVDTAVVTSGSGDIRLGRASGRTEIRTGSGDVLAEAGSDITIGTGSGDAVVGSTTGRVRLSTGSGDLTIRTAVEGEIQAKSASGDVTVGVASGTAALLDCSTVSGRVSSELTTDAGPADGEKGVVLRLRSVSGDVLVRRG